MKIICVLSGGMDSGTLLYDLHAQGHDVRAVSILYKQRHAKELIYAEQLAKAIQIPWSIIDLSALSPVFSGSSQTDDRVPVPFGRYDDPSMKLTVVPNRNMILLSVATAAAISQGCSALAYGAHAGDHAIYPDCRPVFVEHMSQAISVCDWEKIELLVPYLHLTKADICQRGLTLQVPFHLTWTCYVGGDQPCGQCGACVERAEAFAACDAVDPLLS